MEPKELLANKDFVCALARSLIADEHLAEDVIQETWLAALRTSPADSSAVKSWLSSVVRNLSKLFLRRETRLKTRERAAASTEMLPSTDKILEQEVEKLRLAQAVQSLKEPYRAAVVLRYYENMPPRRIAKHLNIPVETVKTRLHRALAMLRQELDRTHGGDRRQWLMSLIPIAGLKGEIAGASTILGTTDALAKGVFTMSMKVKTGIAATLLIIGAAIILWQAGPETGPPDPMEGTAPVARAEVEKTEVETKYDDLAELRRVPLVPVADLAGMPDSYKQALGGFTGRVVHADGSPAARRNVELIGIKLIDFFKGMDPLAGEEYNCDGLASWSAVTGEDGIFHILSVYPQSYFALSVSPQRSDSTTRLIDTQPNAGETVDLGDIPLPAGTEIFGKVVNERGKSLPGARVRAVQFPAIVFQYGLQDLRENGAVLIKEGPFREKGCVIEPPGEFFRLLHFLAVRETFTDSNGTFRLRGVPAGSITVVADKPGFVSQWQGVSLTGEEAQDAGSIELTRGTAITGKVINALHRPVAGAEVRLGSYFRELSAGILQPSVFTDEAGRFTCDGVSPVFQGCAALRPDKDTSWKIVCPLRPGDNEHVFALDGAYDLKVMVTQQDGRPVKDATLKVREQTMQNLLPFSRKAAASPSTNSPEAGTFIVENLSTGTYEFRVSAPGYCTGMGTVVIQNGPVEKDVTLEPCITASVQVMAGRDQAPLEWAEVMIRKEPAADQPSQKQGRPKGMEDEDWFLETSEHLLRRTNAEGIAQFDDLGTGRYRAIVIHPGYATTVAGFELPNEKEIQVVMDPGGILEGVVLFDHSVLKPPFAVYLEPCQGTGFSGTDIPRMVHTDRRGRFKVSRLCPGSWKVLVMKRLFNMGSSALFEAFSGRTLAEDHVVILSQETTRLELWLQQSTAAAAGRVIGRVCIDNLPVEGAVVHLKGSKDLSTQTAASGFYSLEEVPAEDCKLKVQIPPGPSGEFAFRIERRILVAADASVIEDFHITTGTLFGRVVLHPGGTPLPGAEIRASGVCKATGTAAADLSSTISPPAIDGATRGYTYFNPGYRQIIADTSGNFRLGRIPAGIYNLEWLSSQKIGRTDTERELLSQAKSEVTVVEILPGSVTGPVEVVVYPPFKVAGRVELPEGFEKEGWKFLVVNPAEKISSTQQTTVCVDPVGIEFSYGGGKLVDVGMRSGKFEIKDVTPGWYTAVLIAFTSEKKKVTFKPLKFEVPAGGVIDLVLRPEPEEETAKDG